MAMCRPDNVNVPTALLVDDDDQLRTFCRDLLVKNGFRVLESDNGFEALLVAANHDGAVDILIADLEMPRISGIELAHVFKAIWPTTCVLYISGSLCESTQAELDADFAYLRKPFLPGTFLKTIGKVLDARAREIN
jgi:two-component system, cell cycle sensor histidine kinase and response regulator CckA